MAITTEKIQTLLGDLENDSVERTISTNNTDKFGQAICAFANEPGLDGGYILLGVSGQDKHFVVIGLEQFAPSLEKLI